MMSQLEAKTEISGSNDAAPKMLVVDDDPSIVRMLRDRCTLMGFDVETATNGIQALLKASRFKPDILVIDVHMPEVDGLSVCAHLLDPDRAPLHVVVATGSRDSETVERCDGFGAFFVHKGAGFWSDLAASLSDLYPQRAERIREVLGRSSGVVVNMRPRVLLIDDDPDVGKFLASRLEKCGVEMIYAGNAVDGLKMACRDEPTVIIADYSMPNGDARHLLTRLRSMPKTELVPVIVLTGRKLDEFARNTVLGDFCGRPGAVKILQKSLDHHELFDELQRLCGFACDGDGVPAQR
jgi:CheY-like chemotaxis protein